MAGQKLGQHFLQNRDILQQIAGVACPSREPLIVEIGPGQGALTEFLVPNAERLIAIELDSRLAALVQARFNSIEVLNADVLDTSLAQWGPAVVAGNLPYYITSPILERICALGPLLVRAVLLMQDEVARRLVAKPGTRDYGFLTVATQLFTEPEILFRVPPGAFAPPPKVDSAVVRLTPRPPLAAEPQRFLQFAGRCFQHKRKTLRNNLLPFYGRKVDAWPEAGLRAEQLSVERLAELFGRVS